MRIACVLVPAFPLQAAARERSELDLAALPVAVYPAEDSPARARLSAVNRAASARGLRAGHGLSHARALCPEALLVAVGEAARSALASAAGTAAASVVPALEAGPEGSLYAELDSVLSLHGGERGAAAALRGALLRSGIESWIGVGGTRLAARAAARQGRGIAQVPEGQDRLFLAPLPVGTLEASEEVRATLARWGLATLGDLARLPRDGVGARLGPEGVRLHRLACGEEVDPWQPSGLSEEAAESVELEWGVAQTEPLLFALRAPLSRLVDRLAARGLACGGLSLRFALEPRGLWSREVAVAAPTREIRSLLALVRFALERAPPPAPVVGLRVGVTAARAAAAQHRLFGLPEVSAEQLGTTLARLEALAGPGSVGAPVLRDTHLPGDEAAGVDRFAPPPPPDRGEVRPDRPATLEPRDGGSRVAEPSRDPMPGAAVLPRGSRIAAFRLFRPPRPVEVLVERGCPAALHGASVRGRVIDCAGPWPVEARWWGTQARVLDCYDVSLGDGGTYRLALDRRTGRWQLQGEYD